MSGAKQTLPDDRKAFILAEGPVGQWRTVAGSADVLGGGDVRFSADGTGLVTIRSMAFGNEDVPFAWTMRGPGELAVRYADIEDDWETLRLAFEVEQTDLGAVEVLREAGPSGFWFLPSPLRWVGP